MIKRNVGKIAIGTLVFAAVIGLALTVGLRAAENPNASAKVTAQCRELTLATGADEVWTTVLENTIKCANQKDLFIDVSMESSLLTQTKAKGTGGNKDTSMAEAGIEVRVVIDGDVVDPEDPNNWANPGVIVFAKRIQTLSVQFDELTEGEIELILETTSANSFNFIVEDISSGVHTIWVQVRPDTETSGDADATAAIGSSSFTVEEVRCVKDDDITI